MVSRRAVAGGVWFMFIPLAGISYWGCVVIKTIQGSPKRRGRKFGLKSIRRAADKEMAKTGIGRDLWFSTSCLGIWWVAKVFASYASFWIFFSIIFISSSPPIQYCLVVTMMLSNFRQHRLGAKGGLQKDLFKMKCKISVYHFGVEDCWTPT